MMHMKHDGGFFLQACVSTLFPSLAKTGCSRRSWTMDCRARILSEEGWAAAHQGFTERPRLANDDLAGRQAALCESSGPIFRHMPHLSGTRQYFIKNMAPGDPSKQAKSLQSVFGDGGKGVRRVLKPRNGGAAGFQRWQTAFSRRAAGGYA